MESNNKRGGGKGGPRRAGVVAALRRGFAMAIDACVLDRLQEAARAEASVCAALHALGEEGAGAIERLRSQGSAAKSKEARFVWSAALHALGADAGLPELPREGLAQRSTHWRAYRRRLRRLGAALASGGSLGTPDQDLLSEAGSMLDRMRLEGAPGVGWPNAWMAASRQRGELSAAVAHARSPARRGPGSPRL